LRSECATLEHHATETTNDILKEIIEDISNLEKDFYKVQASDVNEMNFLKQQTNTLV
jgi:glutamate synthase domain-containing protein 3